MVIAIVAIGWFSLIPNLDLAQRDKEQGRDALEQLNELMAEARDAALAEDYPQLLRFHARTNVISWRKENNLILPWPITRVEVNGQEMTGPIVPFLIMRGGVSDSVRLVAHSELVFATNPLEAVFVQEE